MNGTLWRLAGIRSVSYLHMPIEHASTHKSECCPLKPVCYRNSANPKLKTYIAKWKRNHPEYEDDEFTGYDYDDEDDEEL